MTLEQLKQKVTERRDYFLKAANTACCEQHYASSFASSEAFDEVLELLKEVELLPETTTV